MLFHHVFEQTHWENLYYLLCAFSFYFLTKSIFFENMIMSSIRSYWGNFYHLLCAFSFYFLTSSIFFENTITSSIRSYWENSYHLLCAFSSSSFYFSMSALSLRKPLLFTMCFLILFLDELDFLWKHNYELNSLLLRKPLSFTMCFLILFLDERTEKTSIIYYVLSHRVSRWAHCHWENLYYLMSAFSLNWVIEKTSIIYYVLSHSILRWTSWKHLYYLLCAFSLNRVSRWTHYHWRTLYYFVYAFSSCSSMSALSLRKPLLFSECFLSYRCSRLDIDSDHDRCQSHFLKHWENLYHLINAFSSYFLMSALRKLLSFSKCFLIIFLDKRIEKR